MNSATALMTPRNTEGTEKEAFIDPRRNLDEVAGRKGNSSTAPQSVPLPPAAIAATVLFETTAVGAKLRNTHKVGGERVKEMDHFVASVSPWQTHHGCMVVWQSSWWCGRTHGFGKSLAN
jgi:hypothetical protein